MEGDREVVNLREDLAPVTEAPQVDKQPKRRFVGRRTAAQESNRANAAPSIENATGTGTVTRTTARNTRALNQIPPEILNDEGINAAIALLPPNYKFELHKTIHRIRTSGARHVALQFPEGLLLFATTISDILSRFCPGISTLIMGDVTYGACCVDDYTARALGCDMLIHYAHSCLIPVSVTQIQTLYVFVDIGIDVEHLVASIERNFKPKSTIAMVGTIQFNATLHGTAPLLRNAGYNIILPQITPLSKGEILGCTSPDLSTREEQIDCILYLGDGRFHLESAMIHNPHIPAYKYDPYSRMLTHEGYDHDTMLSSRSSALASARRAKKWGLILGSLGRQGNPHTMALIERELKRRGTPWVNLLLSEIFPGKLATMPEVECWVQVACPRLSIDWGYAFPRPLLTPYEALVVLGKEQGWEMSGQNRGRESDTGRGVYPMDYYGSTGLGRATAEQTVA